jgi:cytochrome b
VAAARVKVWDPLVRIAHWGVAAAIVADLVNEAGANPWHRWIGYAALALVVVRLAWGLVGSAHARLSTMAHSASGVRAYLSSKAARVHAGHNPLGALMAFALWGLVIACGVTGWMLQLESFWGDDTLQALHAVAAYAIAVLAVIHVVGAIVTSVRQRTNLVKSMFTGVKRIRT